MTPPVISQETKDENFQAIAPRRHEPVMVRAPDQKSKPYGFVFFALFLTAVAGAFWFYSKNETLKKQVVTLQKDLKDQKEKNDVSSLSPLEKLNKHILLPQAQNAQISTLSMVKDLKQADTFYEYAQDGNLLVQFPNLDVIYDANADVIINARTKNTGQVAGTEARALQGAVSLEIRNGSGVAGAAGKTAETFKGVKDYVVKTIGNASKSSFAATIVVNLSGKDVTGLEKQFGVKAVSVLPSGEKSSDADVVIIVGKK
jgi:hypothetical protein